MKSKNDIQHYSPLTHFDVVCKTQSNGVTGKSDN